MSRSVYLRLAVLAVIAGGFLSLPMQASLAQSERNVGELRLYIQQLEEQVRQLTGQVEQLQFQLQQAQGGAVTGSTLVPVDNSSASAGAPPVDLGGLSVSINDPLVAPDGATADAFTGSTVSPQPAPQGWTPEPGISQQPSGFPNQVGGAPLDLSALAGGSANAPPSGNLTGQTVPAPLGQVPNATGVLANQPDQLAALGTGDAAVDYDIAYGSILNGNYGQAEQLFGAWLANNPNHERSNDASFWFAESQLQQGKNREAASGFLEIYRSSPNSRKAPDSLMKLGVALAQLGETNAACATFREVESKYPNADQALKDRTNSESVRAGC